MVVGTMLIDRSSESRSRRETSATFGLVQIQQRRRNATGSLPARPMRIRKYRGRGGSFATIRPTARSPQRPSQQALGKMHRGFRTRTLTETIPESDLLSLSIQKGLRRNVIAVAYRPSIPLLKER